MLRIDEAGQDIVECFHDHRVQVRILENAASWWRRSEVLCGLVSKQIKFKNKEANTSKLKVFVEPSEVEHRNHGASSVRYVLRPKLLGRVAELKSRGEAVQAGENATV